MISFFYGACCAFPFRLSAYAFLNMENLHQKQHGQPVIGNYRHQVVDGGNQWAGGHGRVDMNLMKNIGMMVPIRLETTMATTSETPTQPEIKNAESHA